MSSSVLAINVAVAERIQARPRRDLSIDYLRTMITVGVVLHHSMLAYASWAVVPQGSIIKAVIPVVDSTRWNVLDYVIGYNDAFFMAIMFFVSGLFVVPALQKHGTGGFIRDRLKRLGIPFLFSIFLINPIGYYMLWPATSHTAGIAEIYKQLAAVHFVSGSAWFIWFLLAMDLGVAAILKVLTRKPFTSLVPALKHFTSRMGNRPFETAAMMFALSVLVYVPMLYHFGYSRSAIIVARPFILQISRLILYPLWFSFGALVGAWGLSRGLLSRESTLARRWPYWMVCSLFLFSAPWLFQTLALSMPAINAHARTPLALVWVAFFVSSCLAFIGLFSRIQWSYHPWMKSLSRCAYGIYLVHYVFVAAAQCLFLNRPIQAGVKTLMVFFIAVLFSWLTTSLLLRIPRVNTVI